MKPLFVLLIMIFSTAAGFGVEEDRVLSGDMSIGKRYLFPSKMLDADQRYRVLLPMSYEQNPTAKYPVLYVLDGGHAFATLTYSTMLSHYGFGTKVPEAIIVAIQSNNRFRDYTAVNSATGYDGKTAPYLRQSGRGETYKAFLKQEFIPHIEKHYRVNGYRALLGHSIGGYFVFFDMLSAEPLFKSYLSVDPSLWFGGGHLIQALPRLSGDILPSGGKAYVSVALSGLKSDDPDVVSYQRTKLPRVEAVQDYIKQANTSFSMKVDLYPDEHHGSVVPVSFHEGLRYLFEGYEPPGLEKIANEPELVARHFDAYSKTTGVTFIPDYRVVTDAAMTAAGNGMQDNATALFELNAANFPKSNRILSQLARHYENRDREEKALTVYREILLLSPEDETAQRKIEELSRSGQ